MCLASQSCIESEIEHGTIVYADIYYDTEVQVYVLSINICM